MKSLKNIIAAALAVSMCATFSGCGKNEAPISGIESRSESIGESTPENSGASSYAAASSVPSAPSEPETETGTDESNFIVQPTDGGVYIERYVGSDTNVVIPETIDGKSVVGIGEDAFGGNDNITSVTIPGSVKWLSKSDEGWDEGDFDYLMTVYASARGAFAECKNLKDVTFLGSTAPDFMKGDFYDTPWLEKKKSENPDYLAVNNTLICWWKNEGSAAVPDGITKINRGAFLNEITSISIPDSVTEIGNYAFHASGIKSIVIPDSVTKLGAGAFSNCTRLESITLSKNLTCINANTFYSCSGGTYGRLEINVPDGVTEIHNTAFDFASVYITYRGKTYDWYNNFYNDTQNIINWVE